MDEGKLIKDEVKILVVDDVEVNRFVLRDIINDLGHKPILTENGVQALKVLKRLNPELILLDVAMPEMDGYEFCRIVKDDPQTREIPIIFISAYDEPVDIVKGFDIGGEDYITKPFIPEVVKARINLQLKLSKTNNTLMVLNRQLKASVDEQLKQMEREKKKVLYALARVARENACYDEDNMDRIKYNCRILTQAMQLSKRYEKEISDSYIETIELAAPLCDLGNVAIPSDILQKDTSLTEEQKEVVKNHAEIGARILKDVKSDGDYNDFLQMSIDIAYYHHENWDGTGYPKGLKGEEIPVSAQVVSVVSAYCALTGSRSYRKAFSKEEALDIIKKESNKKFNPEIVDILVKIYRQLH